MDVQPHRPAFVLAERLYTYRARHAEQRAALGAAAGVVHAACRGFEAAIATGDCDAAYAARTVLDVAFDTWRGVAVRLDTTARALASYEARAAEAAPTEQGGILMRDPSPLAPPPLSAWELADVAVGRFRAATADLVAVRHDLMSGNDGELVALGVPARLYVEGVIDRLLADLRAELLPPQGGPD